MSASLDLFFFLHTTLVKLESEMKEKWIHLLSDLGNATKFGYVKILNFRWGKK